MMIPKMYGKMPVPFSVGWSDEKRMWIAPCEYANGMMALHQEENPGSGKPTFGTPNNNRQRKALALGLCDICGMSMKNRTKVSMSEERVAIADGEMILTVVEPLCCRTCARLAVQHCPHLKRRIKEGLIIVRHVFAYRLITPLLTGEATMEFAGEYKPGTVGHLKMQLTKFRLRDLAWLEP